MYVCVGYFDTLMLASAAFLHTCVCHVCVCVGYFDTLMSASAASTSSELDPQDMEASGISHGYVRMSVGITGKLG